MNYPVYIHQDDDGTASGFFPGVSGCYFAGDSFEEALADASSALDAHFELMAEGGADIPRPTAIADHKHDEECTDGVWALVDLDTSKYEGKSQKINITLPEILIAKIDSYVKTHSGEYGSRSGFLAIAARHEMKHS